MQRGEDLDVASVLLDALDEVDVPFPRLHVAAAEELIRHEQRVDRALLVRVPHVLEAVVRAVRVRMQHLEELVERANLGEGGRVEDATAHGGVGEDLLQRVPEEVKEREERAGRRGEGEHNELGTTT